MRHRKASQRLSRPLGHRRATLRNLVIALLKYEQIKTTKAKAKETQRLAERLISLGKQSTLQARRNAYNKLHDKSAVQKLFTEIAPLFKNRLSGFSRVIKMPGYRGGDGAQMVILELTERKPKVKPKETKKEKAKEEKAPPKKTEKEKAQKTELEKPRPEKKAEEKPKFPKEKSRPAKKVKPKKFLGGLRKLFKKERDSL
ncbi:MAG: 50S ribosomal protein L17 [Candidatus Omnitrophica bacterium]|nr:50S ribosomal protein L17 [Candidatus Omnitrophota bacterium]